MIPLPIVGGSSDWRWASTGRWESEVGGPLDERGMMGSLGSGGDH